LEPNEIRFRFLYALYQKTHGENTHDKIEPQEIISLGELDDLDKTSIITEVTYLNKEDLIAGDHTDGKKMPSYVSTTNWGIKTINQIMNETLSYFIQNPIDEISSILENIQSIESNQEKYELLLTHSKINSVLLNKLKEKIAALISNPGF